LSRRFFRIDPIGNGLHRVTEIDHSKYPNRLNDAVVPPGLPAPRSKSQLDNVEPAINTQVRLLAAYTTKAKQQAPNVVNLVKLAVASANKAYVNTGIPITLVLAGTMSAGVYADGPDTGNQWSKRLSDVTGLNNPNTLKVVRTKREQLKADLVTLIVGNSLIYCGLAWIIPDPSPATSQYGYSEIAQGCLSGGIVLPHELGHNMGLNHDRFTYKQQTGLTPPNSQYNFGYVNLPARIVSIMSYLSACQAKGITCNYIPWFSTSKKKYQGKSVMGIAQNKAGGADSTRRLNETRTGISKYR
jgi:hypothetical protein